MTTGNQPPQPPIVTFTAALALLKLPFAILAMARTSWVLARRMRSAQDWLPAIGPKFTVATLGLGLSVAMIRTVTAPGASKLIGTVLPFSAISGQSA